MSAEADAPEFLMELVEEALPDLEQAYTDLTHHDAAALLARARATVHTGYTADLHDVDADDSERYAQDTALAAAVATQILEAVAMVRVYSNRPDPIERNHHA
jgi:hypothetical protein